MRGYCFACNQVRPARSGRGTIGTFHPASRARGRNGNDLVREARRHNLYMQAPRCVLPGTARKVNPVVPEFRIRVRLRLGWA